MLAVAADEGYEVAAGRDEVVTMQQILTATGNATTVLLASIRSVSDMVTLAQHDVDCFTMGPAVAHGFFTDPTTAAAADTFEEAVRQTAREVLPG